MKGKQGSGLSPIFKPMKIGAAIFILIISFFTVAPAIQVQSKNVEMRPCAKSRGCCHKKPVNKQKKNGCEGMNCNPFFCCPYFSLFLLPGISSPSLPSVNKEKKLISNDNRTVSSFSEFWHPPNVV